MSVVLAFVLCTAAAAPNAQQLMADPATFYNNDPCRGFVITQDDELAPAYVGKADHPEEQQVKLNEATCPFLAQQLIVSYIDKTMQGKAKEDFLAAHPVFRWQCMRHDPRSLARAT